MSGIDQLRHTLREKKIDFEEFDYGVIVRSGSPTGFDVWMEEDGKNSIVFFGSGGWHEHFDNPKEAVNCFLFGLSDKARLRVIERGGKFSSCSLEYVNEQGHWVSDSTTGSLFTPFWRKKTIKYLQNESNTQPGA